MQFYVEHYNKQNNKLRQIIYILIISKTNKEYITTSFHAINTSQSIQTFDEHSIHRTPLAASLLSPNPN